MQQLQLAIYTGLLSLGSHWRAGTSPTVKYTNCGNFHFTYNSSLLLVSCIDSCTWVSLDKILTGETFLSHLVCWVAIDNSLVNLVIYCSDQNPTQLQLSLSKSHYSSPVYLDFSPLKGCDLNRQPWLILTTTHRLHIASAQYWLFSHTLPLLRFTRVKSFNKVDHIVLFLP